MKLWARPTISCGKIHDLYLIFVLGCFSKGLSVTIFINNSFYIWPLLVQVTIAKVKFFYETLLSREVLRSWNSVKHWVFLFTQLKLVVILKYIWHYNISCAKNYTNVASRANVFIIAYFYLHYCLFKRENWGAFSIVA